jgi:hypothetical protein
VQGGVVEIVAQLEVDVLAVLRVFRVGEGVRGDEYPLHEAVGHSGKRHYK